MAASDSASVATAKTTKRGLYPDKLLPATTPPGYPQGPPGHHYLYVDTFSDNIDNDVLARLAGHSHFGDIRHTVYARAIVTRYFIASLQPGCLRRRAANNAGNTNTGWSAVCAQITLIVIITEFCTQYVV